jgi:hypothetical protein
LTITTEFYNWQQSSEDPFAARWNSCSPNLLGVRDFLLEFYGGQSLGCHHDRPIVGGSAPSSHAYGAGFDWGWDVSAHGGPGRAVAVELMDWFVDWSAELGVQAIHDYQGSRIWRPPGTSGRPVDSDGWRVQPKGSQMGQDWARWIHLEVPKSRWSDGRSVEERLDAGVRKNWGPQRVLDTREPGGGGMLKANVPRVVPRPGFMPSRVRAYDANITVIDPADRGWLKAWPFGVAPNVAQVNYPGGVGATNNGVTINAAQDGTFRIVSLRDCHVTIDISGVFV